MNTVVSPIEAVAGAGQANVIQTVNLQSAETAPAANPAGEAFRSMLETFQGATSAFETNTGAPSSDPLQAARADLVSTATDVKSVTIEPMKAPEAGAFGSGGSGGQQVLQKSFDHAIFVTLVSQIVSGVSQATSTLVRQQ